MCDFDKGFILCTCKDKPIVHNKNSRRYKKEQANVPTLYRWYLSAFNGYISEEIEGAPMMEGIYEFPAENIGKGLTEEWVLLNLNDRNCFDFDYTPQEGDNLVINADQKSWIYLSFIFRNQRWEIGHYEPFDSIRTMKIEGKIAQIEEKEEA